MGGRAEGLACADPGARTPIGASENFVVILSWNVVPLVNNIREDLVFCLSLNKNNNKSLWDLKPIYAHDID